jgi:GWxTD domain-containing protein
MLKAEQRGWVGISLFLLGCIVFIVMIFSPEAKSQAEFTDAGTLAEPSFFLDVARFRATDPSQTYVEVYYKIAYDNLQFIKADNTYQATFDITVIIYDSGGRQVEVKEWRDGITVDTFDETNDDLMFRNDQISFVLDPGEYKMVMNLIDAESKKMSSQERAFKVTPFEEERLAISDIEFASYVLPDTSESRFVKNGRKVIPNVSRIYGIEDQDLYLYYEIYHLDTKKKKKTGTFDVFYQIRNSWGKLGLSYETTIDKPGESSAQSLKLNLSKLKQGSHTLKIEVKDNDSGHRVEVTGVFTIQWSDLFLVENDFDLLIDQLRYIAREDQIRELKNAPEEKREELWREFWESKDPTPGTPQNELKKEYYRRIRYANENFSSFGQNGWKNDMGAIYIIYGPPSEVERHPYEFTSKPYEIWWYYAINRRFLFVDENGFGDYRLYYPDWYDEGLHRIR